MVKEMKIGTVKSVEDEPIRWSAGMLEAFEQAKRGEWSVVDLNNFWDV